LLLSLISDTQSRMMMTRLNSNIDPAEISKFAAMAEYWWNPSGRLKALHDINPLRLGYIDGRAPLFGKKVLDIGCGGGILSEAMAVSGAHVTGIDMSPAPLGAAISHMETSGLDISYRQSTAEAFADSHPDAFDAVVCMELLEHVPHPESVVRACGRLVRSGGDVFFATLNRNLKSFLFVILGAEYLLGMVERGTHRYSRFIKPEELMAWGRNTGLTVCDLTGLHYNPFTRRFSLGGNTHVNYLIHFKRSFVITPIDTTGGNEVKNDQS
jgi:2-polyprenyl-6-hydroxyphenyl methylase / 3-demethylubiquinone-9 3-methyltransferase